MRYTVLLLALLSCAPSEGINMALPTSREHTYGANEPTRSVDLNAIQDAIVGAKLAGFTLAQFPGGFTQTSGVAASPTGSSLNGYIEFASAKEYVFSGPVLLPGTRITDLWVRSKGPGGNSGNISKIELWVAKGSTTQYLAARNHTDDTDANWQYAGADDLDAVMPYTLGAGESLYYLVNTQYGNFRIAAVGPTVDRL